jgi:hypothetical protein
MSATNTAASEAGARDHTLSQAYDPCSFVKCGNDPPYWKSVALIQYGQAFFMCMVFVFQFWGNIRIRITFDTL